MAIPETPLFITNDGKAYYFYIDMDREDNEDRYGFFDAKETAIFTAHVMGVKLTDVDKPREGMFDSDGVNHDEKANK